MIIYLYKKTHNITGLKYLGKTIRNPFKYKGSGKYWISHIKLHGFNVTTEILKECSSDEELKYWGTYYSNLWNIVESSEWANLKPEEGSGGRTIYGEQHHMRKEEYRNHLRKNIWTKEKRKQQGEKTKISNKNRDNTKVISKLKNSWSKDRRKAQSERMKNNNPAKNLNVQNKISKNNPMREIKNVLKISGDNHYKRQPGYVQNQSGKNHPKFNKTLYRFIHEPTNKVENLTQYELQIKYNLHQGNLSLMINNKRNSVKGWKLLNQGTQ